MNKTALLLTLALSPLPLAAEPLQFNWQQTRATVTETVKEDNSITKLRYDIELQPQGDGNFLLKYHDYELLSVNGQKPKQLEKKAYETMMFPKPNLLIDTSGEPLDIPDWENYYPKLLKKLFKNLSENKDAQPLLHHSEFNTTLKIKSMEEPWCAWVCFWAGQDPQNLPPPAVSEEQMFGFPFDLSDSYQLLKQQKKQRYSTLFFNCYHSQRQAVGRFFPWLSS